MYKIEVSTGGNKISRCFLYAYKISRIVKKNSFFKRKGTNYIYLQ